ncbi:hypothetical protein E3N88_00803 [Mikania micrantha]|uniref:Uncharacterized protein n=1 Tax=Mikania micrantha TaxID=192012 RepID=A0A5N6Q0K0_9ASTR|nr:hypothetical protein E3N88_00803 [Mikania micrantha]
MHSDDHKERRKQRTDLELVKEQGISLKPKPLRGAEDRELIGPVPPASTAAPQGRSAEGEQSWEARRLQAAGLGRRTRAQVPQALGVFVADGRSGEAGSTERGRWGLGATRMCD